jgi:tetratricopeptide (TPR) repeat protein
LGYWIWYLLIAVVAWAFKLPALALVAVAVVLLRRWLPDPVVWIRTARLARELRARVEAYPGDVLARRDLARVQLRRLRAREATRLMEEAIAKGLRDPEAFHLLGLARLRSGDPAAALDPFVRAVEGNERLLMGEPYFAAAEALIAVGRMAEAEDALDRGLAVNGSRMDAYVLLGRVRARRGDREGARRAWTGAVDTWRELPDWLRWKSLGSYVVARWRLRG